MKPTCVGRPERVEVHLLRGQVDAADAHHPALLHRVLHLEHRGVEAGLVVGGVGLAELERAEALLHRPGQLPLVHLLERGVSKISTSCSLNRYISFASGENWMLAFSRSSPFGQGMVLTIFLLARSYCTRDEGSMTNRSTCLTYGRTTIITNRCCGSGSSVLMRTCRLPSVSVKVSTVRARGDVDDLDLLHLRLDGVEALPVARHRGATRHARLVRDGAGDLAGRLVDHLEVIRETRRCRACRCRATPAWACRPHQRQTQCADRGGNRQRAEPGCGTQSWWLQSPAIMGRRGRSCASPSGRRRTCSSSPARD